VTVAQLMLSPTASRGGVAIVVEVWEWVVMHSTRTNPVGVSMTRDRAKAALVQALKAAGRPGRGSVRPMVLVYAPHSGCHYQRMPITNTAEFNQSGIQWT
jgi:hypothetical protein